MLQDQGGEELNCLPRAVFPRFGLHRCADLLLLFLLLLSLLLLQLSKAAACSPSWASSGRREPDVPFSVPAVPGGLEEGTSCPELPRSELRGSGTGAASALLRPASGETTAPRMQGGPRPGRAAARHAGRCSPCSSSLSGRRCGRGGRRMRWLLDCAPCHLHPIAVSTLNWLLN